MWVLWIVLPLLLVIIWQHFIIKRRNNDIAYWKKKLKDDTEKQRNEYEEKLTQKNATDAELAQTQRYLVGAKQELDDLLGEISIENRNLLNIRRLRYRVKNAPLDVTFSKNGMPVYWKPNMLKPYGDYTVYINEKANIYHTDRLCGGYRSKEEHIFNVIDSARPCRKCAEGFYDFITAPDWFTGKESSFDDPSIKVNWRD